MAAAVERGHPRQWGQCARAGHRARAVQRAGRPERFFRSGRPALERRSGRRSSGSARTAADRAADRRRAVEPDRRHRPRRGGASPTQARRLAPILTSTHRDTCHSRTGRFGHAGRREHLGIGTSPIRGHQNYRFNRVFTLAPFRADLNGRAPPELVLQRQGRPSSEPPKVGRAPARSTTSVQRSSATWTQRRYRSVFGAKARGASGALIQKGYWRGRKQFAAPSREQQRRRPVSTRELQFFGPDRGRSFFAFIDFGGEMVTPVSESLDTRKLAASTNSSNPSCSRRFPGSCSVTRCCPSAARRRRPCVSRTSDAWRHPPPRTRCAPISTPWTDCAGAGFPARSVPLPW